MHVLVFVNIDNDLCTQAIQRLTADPRLAILQDVVPEVRSRPLSSDLRLRLIVNAGCREEPSPRSCSRVLNNARKRL
jgi:hypothetical protein